jgi:hypothetical protein
VKDVDLALIGNAALRDAIRRNLVTFPSQVPHFTRRGDGQRQIVQLYFLGGWQLKAICNRYMLSKSAVRSMLVEWKIRAVAAGYIQAIDPDLLAPPAEPDSELTAAEFEWEIASSSCPARVNAVKPAIVFFGTQYPNWNRRDSR